MLYEFQRFSHGNIEVNEHDPTADTDALSLALALDIEEIAIDDISERHLAKLYGYAGLGVRYGDKSEALNDIRSTVHLEREILQRIINVTSEELPKVGIIKTDTLTPIPPEMVKRYQLKQPEGLTSQRYSSLYDILLETYEVAHINMDKREIPADIQTIVIPGGVEAFLDSPLYMKRIDHFIARGGNALVLAPRLDIDLNAMGRQPHITFKNFLFYDLLKHYGVQIGEHVVLDTYCDNIYADGGNVPFKYPYFPVISRDGLNKEHPITTHLSGVILQWASPVKEAEATNDTTFEIDTLLWSSSDSYGNTPPIGLAPNQDWDRLFDRARRQDKPFGPFPLAVSAQGHFTPYYTENTAQFETRPGRIVVVGSDNFVKEGGIGLNNDIFIQNSVDWLQRRDDFINIRSKNLSDRRISEDPIQDNSPLAQRIRLINIFLMPVIICMLGAVIYFRRRKTEQMSLHNAQKSGADNG
jgi:ABC-type uncharacterized transport system involved in gliding motility auxiliary subunit